jgi:hypothetical protein
MEIWEKEKKKEKNGREGLEEEGFQLEGLKPRKAKSGIGFSWMGEEATFPS